MTLEPVDVFVPSDCEFCAPDECGDFEAAHLIKPGNLAICEHCLTRLYELLKYHLLGC